MAIPYAASLTASAFALPPELTRAVPADAVAAWFVDPPPRDPDAERTPSAFDNLTFLIDRAFNLGLLAGLPDTSRGWLDAIAALSEIFEHPHAVTLLDFQIDPADDDSYRLADLRAALVLRTAGRNQRIERRIQHLLGCYTNMEDSRLEKMEFDGVAAHRLHDRRLAEWLTPAWGPLGDYFVIAIGKDGFERIARTLKEPELSMTNDSWFAGGLKALAAENALLTASLRIDRLRRDDDSPLAKKTGQVLNAIGAPNAQRVFWALGFSGKSVEIRQWTRRGSTDAARVLAGEEFLKSSRMPPLPDAASSFAAIAVDPPVALARASEAWLAVKSDRSSRRTRDYWRDIESRADFRFFEGFLDLLGGPVVIHDFPPHALRLPPAWTIIIPIRGDADRLRKNLDALLNVWKNDLEENSRLRLRRDDDGVWCLVAGIDGPAATVSDRHLVISFSPRALRENLPLLAEK